MKKLLKINLFFLFVFIINISVNAQPPPPNPCDSGWDDCNENGGNTGNGDGTRKVPIDDYAPLLVITAVTIAGYFSYRQRQIIKK